MARHVSTQDLLALASPDSPLAQVHAALKGVTAADIPKGAALRQMLHEIADRNVGEMVRRWNANPKPAGARELLRERRLQRLKAELADRLEWGQAFKAHLLSDGRDEIAKAWDAHVTLPGAAILRAGGARDVARLRGTPKRFWSDADWGLARRTTDALAVELEKALPAVAALEALGHDALRPSFETVGPTFKAEPVLARSPDLAAYDRVIRIVPGFDGIDSQHQLIQTRLLHEGWAYYEKNGNVDLEHLTKMGGTAAEARARIESQGFPYDPKVGRVYYEIGRPIPGSFDDATCSFLAYIYSGHEVADWFWKTMTEVSPPIPWRASVGGMSTRPVPVLMQNDDPTLPKGPRQQLVGVFRDFRWNNTACTLGPVNHGVPTMSVVKKSPEVPA